MSEQYMEAQYLEARKRFLYNMRRRLEWTTAQTAKKLKVMETEYINFENGLSKDLSDYDWEDIEFFLTNQLKVLEEK